ncbi:unnamed protein product [Rhizophagus irregularis]|nr:unnamed protein product [Rhizophagus irregularis]
MKVLRLSDGDDIRNWYNDDITDCYNSLRLFGWWHRYQRGILLLYFRNREGMLHAQQWIQQKHPGIRVKEEAGAAYF